MTDSRACVVTPHSRFLERQELRRRIIAELMRLDRPLTIEADARPAAVRHGISTGTQRIPLPNTVVALPDVHMAGSDDHYIAHVEVGPHGFALFLAPEAEYPVLDVNGTPEQLDLVVRGLQAALASRCAANADRERAAQMKPHRAAPSIEPPTTN
jgi:hypothetical protein